MVRVNRVRRKVTYSETEGTHGGHGEDVEPCVLQPLAEGRALGHGVAGAGVAGGVLLAAAEKAALLGLGSSRLGRLLARPLVEKTHLFGLFFFVICKRNMGFAE